ncbi:hypothetical protein C9374_003527 [Naegleria lovaniensis]|uniref:Rab-GAP TBC domain-containing protein n=1 Tax=Naegleria lovaniensis TaxID=51637 RepID=A0AA88GRI5_NAELO|nr:uncharacterized protein C9374_003527 [Naegleria lovaniensis]KAG2385712.1 hypothetical protein C9374_003527 [Naegleria lovaniensis]
MRRSSNTNREGRTVEQEERQHPTTSDSNMFLDSSFGSSSPTTTSPSPSTHSTFSSNVVSGNVYSRNSKTVKLEQMIKEIQQHTYYRRLLDQAERMNRNGSTTGTSSEISSHSINDDPIGENEDEDKQSFTQLLHKLRRLILSSPITLGSGDYETNLGCIKDSLRQFIWPLLLHDSDHLCRDKSSVFHIIKKIDKQHEQYEQVEKDVERSMFKFLAPFFGKYNNQVIYVNTSNASSSSSLNGGVSKHTGSKTMNLELSYKRRNLSLVVNSILQLYKRFQDQAENSNFSEEIVPLYYFQGFHEICSVMLLTFQDNLETTFRCCYRLATNHFYDSMHSPNLDEVIRKCAMIITILEESGHHDICEILRDSGMDQGHYALSWILTWFAHVIEQDCGEDHEDSPYSTTNIASENFTSTVPSLFLVQTLFDVFLAVGNPFFVVYVAASVVIERREELLILKEGGSATTVRQKLAAVSGGRTEIDFPFSADEDDDDINYIEFTVIFGLLNRFPKNITPKWLERVVKRALNLWKHHDYRNLCSPEEFTNPFPFSYLCECEDFSNYHESVADYWRDEEEERLLREEKEREEAEKRRKAQQQQLSKAFFLGGSIVVAAAAFYFSAQSWFFHATFK